MNQLIVLVLCFCASLDAVLAVCSSAGNKCWLDIPEPECTIRMVNAYANNNDTANTEVFKIGIKNIKGVSVEGVSKYVKFSLDERKAFLIATLTPEFEKYAEIENRPDFSVRINFAGCLVTSWIFIFMVKDIENHAPQFLDKPYVYEVTETVLPTTSIAVIRAKDIDLQNRRLMFEVVGKHATKFKFTNSVKDYRIYSTSLVAIYPTQLMEDISLDIRVTDEGIVPMTDTATIILKVQKLPYPLFSEPIYKGIYDVENGLTDKIVTHLNNTLYVPDTVYLFGEFAQYFNVYTRRNEITISANEATKIPEQLLKDKAYIQMILEATYKYVDSPAKTVIHLDVVRSADISVTVNVKVTVNNRDFHVQEVWP